MSDDTPRCFHCNAAITDGEGWRENGLLFLAKDHADDWLSWLADDERAAGG